MAWRIILVSFSMMLALANARAQVDTVYTGQSTILSIIEEPGISYSWELYNDVDGLNLVVVPGNCPPAEAYFVGGVNTGDSVEVMWLEPGIYFYKVTANDGCTDNLKLGKVVVLESMSYAYLLEPDSICPGDTAVFTLEITGGIGPWDVVFTDGVNSWTLEDINTSPFIFQLIPTPAVPGTYEYWISSITSGTGMVNTTPSAPVTLTVMPRPVTSPIYRYDPMSKK
jgi:hypothetical protein